MSLCIGGASSFASKDSRLPSVKLSGKFARQLWQRYIVMLQYSAGRGFTAV